MFKVELNPSTEWTEKERLSVLAVLSGQIYMFAQSGKWLMSKDLFAIAERIHYLTIWPAVQLEANRKQILEGQP